MNILAVVVVYNPDFNLLKNDIESFYHFVNETLIWDNSNKEQSEITRKRLQQIFPELTFCTNGKNEGISYALNYALNYANENEYDFLLTMDDDSIFKDFNSYKKRVQDNLKTANQLAAYGPKASNHKANEKGFEEVPHLITSGMLVPTKLLNKVGGYCKSFFVDGIDIELCIHLRSFGFKCFIDNSSILVQRYGSPVTRRFFGKKISSANYSPQRLYGIFRNHIIILRQYGYPNDLLKHIIKLYFLGFVIKGVILIDKNKIQKLKAVFKGIKDGISFDLKQYNK